MKKLLAIQYMIFILAVSISAQNLECPADVDVNIWDVDQNYNFGTPNVLIPQPYNLSFTLNSVSSPCEGDYMEVVTKEWTLSYDQTTETCTQTINVLNNSFEDYTVPADTTLATGDPNNVGPEITGYYGPEPGFEGIIASTYDDLILPAGNDLFKIIRRWTLLNWCTAEVIEHVQIIKIGVLFGTTLAVVRPDGQAVDGYNYSLLDADGNVLDVSNCSGNIVEQINCLYEDDPNIESISISMSKDVDHLNGVSTLDMVLIQRHILGIESLDSPFKILAADVNNSQTVSAVDMLELRKLILGIYDEFPQTESWKFVHSDINKDLTFSNAELPLVDLVIYGIKMGDVNYSSQ